MTGDDFIREEEAIASERANESARLNHAILEHPIGQLAGLREPTSIKRGSTVRHAIELMNQNHVGCVLICDQDRLVGIFTERDVLEHVAVGGVDVDQTPVESLMTTAPETLTLEDPISFALNRMSVGGFRHIPLVDDDGRPTAIVAMRSICEHLVDLFPREVLNLPPRPGMSIARTREGA